MVVNGILLVFQAFLNILLAPLSVINIGIDLVSSIPYVVQFLQVVAYILPWSNLLPLILLVISLFLFRIGIAVLNFIKGFIPFLG
jgi:hypothetical protein